MQAEQKTGVGNELQSELSNEPDSSKEDGQLDLLTLYKLSLPFRSGGDVEYLFMSFQSEYRHAEGHLICLGDVHGTNSEVSFTLDDEVCDEVTSDPKAIKELQPFLPIGINVVDYFMDALKGGSYEDCECADCVKFLAEKRAAWLKQEEAKKKKEEEAKKEETQEKK